MSVTIPAVGSQAPDFEVEALVGQDFKKLKLSDYKNKWVILFFYPLDFTFVCPTEIIEFSAKADDFRKINCEIIGASVDSNFSHLAWVNQPRKEGGLGGINIPLIGDINKEVSQKYGALLGNSGHTLRATYLIDPKGIIRHISMNDPPVGRNVLETLRLVQGYQFVEEHGEVCPATWVPGGATIKPDPVGSKDFFSKNSN